MVLHLVEGHHANSFVEGSQFSHVVLRKLKIEYLSVAEDSLLSNRFRNHNEIALNQETQENLECSET